MSTQNNFSTITDFAKCETPVWVTFWFRYVTLKGILTLWQWKTSRRHKEQVFAFKKKRRVSYCKQGIKNVYLTFCIVFLCRVKWESNFLLLHFDKLSLLTRTGFVLLVLHN